MSVIDQYSVATVPIEALFGKTSLFLGTGFVWQHEEDFYLITNWHNVSGRDPFTNKHLSKTAAEPDRLRIWWNKKGALGDKFSAVHPLKNEEGKPNWLIHSLHGHQIDVVALQVEQPDAEMHPINKMPTARLALPVGADIFILGYPFGIGLGGLPIWKRGSIASEPDVLDTKRPVIYIDSASRPGMSGSPVIRRSWDSHSMEGGGTLMNGAAATRFVGVYSGRLSTSDTNDPQIGLTWPAKFIDEIIINGKWDS
jgi:hypothetical protein